MELKVGDIVKHFKGESLIEKNIYEILALDVKYTGDNEINISSLVIYKPLFQSDKYFAREYDDLVSELNDEEKLKYNQDTRIQLLTEEELELIRTNDFKIKKEEYIKSKYK